MKQFIRNKTGGSETKEKAIKTVKKRILKKKRERKDMKILKKKKERKKIEMRKDVLPLPVKQEQNNNPSLDFLLEMDFPKTKINYVKAFMKNYLKDKDNISWDEMGNLRNPFQGYNVIKMMHKLIAERSYLDVNELPFYKMFIKMNSIPYEAIKNEFAKSQLEGLKNKRKSIRGYGWVVY